MKLYNFPRSSASFRVRIACALKKLDVEEVLVNFRENAQRSEGYLNVAPSGLVPALETEEITLSQSLAIIRYLDHLHPTTLLIPQDPIQEARVLEMSLAIACDIHPINNLRVLNYIKDKFQADEAAVEDWVKEWVSLGFSGLEALVSKYNANPSPKYCFGDSVSLVDLCLVPQMFNARRFNVPLDDYPLLCAIDSHLTKLPEFEKSAP